MDLRISFHFNFHSRVLMLIYDNLQGFRDCFLRMSNDNFNLRRYEKVIKLKELQLEEN